MINAKGVPTCKQSQLEAQTSAKAEQICKPALLGVGTTDVSVVFPESQSVPLHGKLLAFNGGEQGGTTTIYIHAYLTAPVTAALVTTVKISKEHKGPYGTRSVATIPKIVGYAGLGDRLRPHLPEETVHRQGQEARVTSWPNAPTASFSPRRKRFPRRHQDRRGENRPRLHAEGLNRRWATQVMSQDFSRALGFGRAAGTLFPCEAVGKSHAPYPGRVG